jgi:hypothetical protein
MIQLQINVTHKNNNLSFQLNNLAREDATDLEKETGDQLERVFLEVVNEIAKQSGLKSTKKNIIKRVKP